MKKVLAVLAFAGLASIANAEIYDTGVITIDLAGYAPPTNNDWWQIRYTFSGTVTDRTTWSARIIGDPVHLVEEY